MSTIEPNGIPQSSLDPDGLPTGNDGTAGDDAVAGDAQATTESSIPDDSIGEFGEDPDIETPTGRPVDDEFPDPETANGTA